MRGDGKWTKRLHDEIEIVQGYLTGEPERVVRVRVVTYDTGARIDGQGFLTVKGKAVGMKKKEFDYQVPIGDAEEMMEMHKGFLIKKTRYGVEGPDGHLWSVDVFHDENRGLVLAELELESETQAFEKPHWLGEEVTDDHRYSNQSLSIHPFCYW